MNYIVDKWGQDDEKLWIRNPEEDSELMQITNNQMMIWVCAILHNMNPEIDLNHPPETKEFKWIKHHTPTLSQLHKQSLEYLAPKAVNTLISPTAGDTHHSKVCTVQTLVCMVQTLVCMVQTLVCMVQTLEW